MSLKLQEALADEHCSMALRRLHNVYKLVELQAPDLVIEKSRELLSKSKSIFGHKFSEIDGLYPEYKVWVEEQDRIENAWQDRCRSCLHMQAVDQEDPDRWCAKYTVDDRTIPDPCPSHEGKH